jgi:hypothetical protein
MVSMKTRIAASIRKCHSRCLHPVEGSQRLCSMLCAQLYSFEGSYGMLMHSRVLGGSVKISYFFDFLSGIESMRSEGGFEELSSISSSLLHFEQSLVYFNGDSIPSQ